MAGGIIFVATRFSWMRPYAITALRQLWDDDSHLVVAVDDIATESRHLDWLPADRVHYIRIPQGWFASKYFQLHPTELTRMVDELVATVSPRVVLSFTSDHPLSRYLKHLQRRVPTIYVAHNTHPHALSAKNLRGRIFNHFWYRRPLLRLLRTVDHQIVNARWQMQRLEQQYPGHKVGYLPFPSLITEQIAQGHDTVPELAGTSGYILFFGMVHSYKGVDRLIDIYASSQQLQARRLVIAGRGVLGTSIPKQLSDKIIHINRFIPDSQIAQLFAQAAVIVYPYIAATQSGVLSIASYFGRPIVASDIPFFREMCHSQKGCTLIDTSDTAAAAEAIAEAADSNADSSQLYSKHYAHIDWRADFNKLIDEWFPENQG